MAKRKGGRASGHGMGTKSPPTKISANAEPGVPGRRIGNALGGGGKGAGNSGRGMRGRQGEC